ncbi:hypothetical protein ASH00_02880 [Arthrobacter sp. Soil782]|uniref:DUF885 domain-containing protein n=1 Tax=Arthrobacter sp. Soil782 TaxID=1736410 RepID=UPI0006F5DF7A|nr:DUF885 domain-containing protein [Arthrobacter sp. Soil782]KRF08661.1 hypothetical protein ASH00_02880 [Arthrobacter sp. Soil782]
MTDTLAPVRRARTAIDDVADAFFLRLLELKPELATSLGILGYGSGFFDYSPAGQQAYSQAIQETLAELEGLNPADDVDGVTLDAMRERLGLELEFLATGITELNNIECPSQLIRNVFDLMPTETAADWEHIAERLANVSGALEGYIASLRKSRDEGHVAAARQVRAVAWQAREHANNNGFFTSLAAGAQGRQLDAGTRDLLERGAAGAAAAYAGFANFLETELLPAAPGKDAVGREYYELCSRRFLGTAVDLDETYAWAVAELDRLIAEQVAVAGRIKSGATIEEAKAILNSDPARQLKGSAALRDWMQATADQALSDLAGVHFDIPAPMNRLECMIAPTQEGVIYYSVPSDDFSRPGRMWWSIPPGEDEFTTWAETSTVYHEGVPGHHLQYGTATYQKELLNNWRRHACWVSGHGEGWALYAERLMLELGYLADPGDHLGMLDMQRMRAARVVFDIGVHLELEVPAPWGSGTWTPEKGYEFLTRHLDISEGALEFEFTRYLGWPGQASSYKVGQRLWEEIRAVREQADGAAFDLRAFHTEALNLGSVGLDTLRRALLPAGPGLVV